MKCSPAAKRDSKIKGSCYTAGVLVQIKNAYNKHHAADQRISASAPEEIWLALNDRLSSCEKEDCWLREIKDELLRKRLGRFVFAPDRPKEWAKNPNEWLSNFDILGVLEQYETAYKNFEFVGPSPIDFDAHVQGGKCVETDLCTFNLKSLVGKGKTQIGVVFNLDKHDQGGSHWVSLYVDTTNKIIFYFDSAGARIPKAIDALVKRIQHQALADLHFPLKFYQNSPKTHQYNNTECGVYSLFFIITMLTGKTEFNANMTIQDKLDLFKKHRIPDKYVEKYRNVYFNG